MFPAGISARTNRMQAGLPYFLVLFLFSGALYGRQGLCSVCSSFFVLCAGARQSRAQGHTTRPSCPVRIRPKGQAVSSAPPSAGQQGALRSFPVERVAFGQRHDLFFLVEVGAVSLELAPDRPIGAQPHLPASHPQGEAALCVRSTWPRKRVPRPAPSCAPSIKPGISARTKSTSPARMTPRLGCKVVKG